MRLDDAGAVTGVAEVAGAATTAAATTAATTTTAGAGGRGGATKILLVGSGVHVAIGCRTARVSERGGGGVVETALQCLH